MKILEKQVPRKEITFAKALRQAGLRTSFSVIRGVDATGEMAQRTGKAKGPIAKLKTTLRALRNHGNFLMTFPCIFFLNPLLTWIGPLIYRYRDAVQLSVVFFQTEICG